MALETTNTASSPFWDIQASDLLKTAVESLSSLSSAKTAKALTIAQQSAPPQSTIDSTKQALFGTNLASVAATLGVVMVLAAGGLLLFKKVK